MHFEADPSSQSPGNHMHGSNEQSGGVNGAYAYGGGGEDGRWRSDAGRDWGMTNLFFQRTQHVHRFCKLYMKINI